MRLRLRRAARNRMLRPVRQLLGGDSPMVGSLFERAAYGLLAVLLLLSAFCVGRVT